MKKLKLTFKTPIDTSVKTLTGLSCINIIITGIIIIISVSIIILLLHIPGSNMKAVPAIFIDKSQVGSTLD